MMSLPDILEYHYSLYALFGVLLCLFLLSVFWPRSSGDSKPARGNLLTTLGVVAGVAVLVLTTSSDEKYAARNVAQMAKLKTEERQVEAKLSSMGVEKAQLEKHLAETDAQRKQAADETRALRESLLKAASEVADTSNPDRLKIKDVVLFDTGKAILRPDAKEKLAKLVGFLTASLLGRPSKIYIDGHTDNKRRGAFDNQQLSDKRAAAVRDYLREAGFPKEILYPRGHADRQPYGFDADTDQKTIDEKNATPEFRQQNRRVEIVLASP